MDLRKIVIVMAAALALGACTQNDAKITRTVEEGIAASQVDSDQVKVWTERRVVHLEGVVENTEQLNKMEMAARNVSGVLGVDNRLVVKNPVETTGGKLGEPPEPVQPAEPLERPPTKPPPR